jgi:uncharacterized membrane protein YgdD (TMEM256/DUF423 family)
MSQRPASSLPLVLAGVLGFLGVALGAFGAHALKGWLSTLPDGADRLAWWHTGVQYHLWHAVLLVGVGAWLRQVPDDGTQKPLRIASWLTLGGIALFSGSLYAMALTGIRVLGAVTPFGGVCFLGAWCAVAVAAMRK